MCLALCSNCYPPIWAGVRGCVLCCALYLSGTMSGQECCEKNTQISTNQSHCSERTVQIPTATSPRPQQNKQGKKKQHGGKKRTETASNLQIKRKSNQSHFRVFIPVLALVGRERMKWDKTRICKLVLRFQGGRVCCRGGCRDKETHTLAFRCRGKHEGLVNVHHRKH